MKKTMTAACLLKSRGCIRNTLAGLIALSSVGGIGGCDRFVQSDAAQAVSVPQAQTEQGRLLQYFEQMDQEKLSRSPMYGTYRGKKIHYDRWDTVSQSFQDDAFARDQARLEALDAFDRSQLDESALLSLDLARYATARSVRADAFRFQTYVMHQFSGWHTNIPSFLINMHRVETTDDLDAYVSRLNDIDRLLDEVDVELQLHAEKGVYPPRWSFPQMLEATRNVIRGAPFTEGDDSTLLADFKKKLARLDLSTRQQTKYLKRVKTALLDRVKPSYEQLIARLEQQYQEAPPGDGVWRLPNGKAFYTHLLNYYTTTDLTADEIHQLGLEQVKRIHGDMRAIMEQVGFTGDLPAFFEFMRTDSQFYYPETDEGRGAYLSKAVAAIDQVKARLPEYFGIFPKAELDVKAVEAFREKSAGKAFYQGPAADGSRPGIYYANLYKMSDMPTYQLEALAYHEGIPGHHMQLAITAELEGVPEFQKYLRFTAYSEGWGLYSEHLAKDMGFYQDPYSDFGRLAMELWRACRLVVDTGIHAKRWTREQAIQYLQDNTPNPKNDTVKAIERYIVYPGQATSYLIGKMKILELRETAQQALGERFDIRQFHDEILKDGPVPLTVLEQKIQRWIDSKKA